jgi:hypothetical protein
LARLQVFDELTHPPTAIILELSLSAEASRKLSPEVRFNKAIRLHTWDDKKTFPQKKLYFSGFELSKNFQLMRSLQDFIPSKSQN